MNNLDINKLNELSERIKTLESAKLLDALVQEGETQASSDLFSPERNLSIELEKLIKIELMNRMK